MEMRAVVVGGGGKRDGAVGSSAKDTAQPGIVTVICSPALASCCVSAVVGLPQAEFVVIGVNQPQGCPFEAAAIGCCILVSGPIGTYFLVLSISADHCHICRPAKGPKTKALGQMASQKCFDVNLVCLDFLISNP
jgi:hypothetical protein